MKKSLAGLLGAGFLGLLCAPGLIAAEPTPILDFDFMKAAERTVKDSANSGLTLKLGPDTAIEKGMLTLNPSDGSFAAADANAFRKWAQDRDISEMAAAFWIRFDKPMFGGASNAKTASLGLFDCFVDANGFIAVKVFSAPTEILPNTVIPGKVKVEYGKWYHVEFSYSMNSRRYALYIDGKFQTENDSRLLPFPAIGELKLGDGFRGAIGNLKFYDAALDSEELALARTPEDDVKKLLADANALAGTVKNPALKDWVKSISARIAKVKYGTTTVAAYKRIVRDLENAQKLAAAVADPKTAIADKVVTAYVTPATTQALYLPYALPENGSVTNKMDVIMAQDEFETASVLVVPFRPVKQFTLKMGDLKNGNSVIKGSDVDIRLVKRWFRTGGAWMSYHVDLYMRVLTPDMLLHDDNLVQVDDFRRTNKILFHYPGGDRRTDVSKFSYTREWLTNEDYLSAFYDAPTLLPLTLPEAGRNQQYIVTFRANKNTVPGFYEGKLQLLADGADAGTINVTVRVLPFALPQPKTYYDLEKPYISHVNGYTGTPSTLKNAMDHNLMQLSSIDTDPERLKTAVKIGYPLDMIFTGMQLREKPFEFGGPDSKRTPELERRMEKMALAPFLRHQAMIEKYTGIKDYIIYRCQTSEASWYGAISLGPDRLSRLLNDKTHFRMFSHGMSDALPYFSPGIYDMNSSSGIRKWHADIWHAAGGRCINYAFPFPGPENPGLMRRALGLELYKANLYDGHMMHGYMGALLNEFCKYPGGDGDYRTFCLAYMQKDGFINRIAIIGCREGYDDVRYATLLKQRATDAMNNSKDQLVVREAKRQLAWLERVDGEKMDMDAFRTDVQFRILTLQNLVKEREGK